MLTSSVAVPLQAVVVLVVLQVVCYLGSMMLIAQVLAAVMEVDLADSLPVLVVTSRCSLLVEVAIIRDGRFNRIRGVGAHGSNRATVVIPISRDIPACFGVEPLFVVAFVHDPIDASWGTRPSSPLHNSAQFGAR